jgi:hypothetical protein
MIVYEAIEEWILNSYFTNNKIHLLFKD